MFALKVGIESVFMAIFEVLILVSHRELILVHELVLIGNE